MKTSIVLLVFICTVNIYAQVGIGTTSPASTAVLDLTSTAKGFLPPRMTKAERDGIATPPAGLMIWCGNCGVSGQLQVYDGTAWTNMIGGPPFGIAVGDSYGGGKVAYILMPGDPGYDALQIHGLIATANNQSTSAVWGCPGTPINGADGTILGTGNQNTIDIVNACPTADIAARICYDLVLGGYSDWYLPSRDELHKLFLNRVSIGGFDSYNYWSSSEFDANLAWYQFFANGYIGYNNKANSFYVRAVRAF